ncbi:MAG: hypothetical protein JNK14_20755 [Chitinophagaceae bacterium]|nr:hypothetical protein [Chitinophagaceae bacterium]
MNDFITPFLDQLKHKAIISSYGSEISPDQATYFISPARGNGINFKIDGAIIKSNLLTDTYKEKLKTIFYNNIWPKYDLQININRLIQFIDLNYPTNLAIEKQGRVLYFIRSQCPYDGYQITISISDYAFSELWRKAYVANVDEFFFYVDSLIDNSYLSCITRSDDAYHEIALTVAGLNRLAEYEKKQYSSICFVAMSFDESLRYIFDQAIEPAISETGFEALRIDDNLSIGSDITINDAILAALKKSKFTIADFTQHKKGVYFESGYALGLGQKVIYTCREDEIENAHFDTRNYPHIVWKDTEDLKKKLIDKIEVFIKS